MQYTKLTLLSALAISANAQGYTPGNPWDTLTPTGTYECGFTDYSSAFGIAVATVNPESMAKREVAIQQIVDGQIQRQSNVTSSTEPNFAITTMADEVTTTIFKTVAVTKTVGGSVVVTSETSASESIMSVTRTTLIPDTESHASTAELPTMTGPVYPSNNSTTPLQPGNNSTISSNNTMNADDECPAMAPTLFYPRSCNTDSTLSMTLNNGVLIDSAGRIGSIVSNRQFQFDGPPPQAGSIYAGGWSVTPEGNLALGSSDIFYQCLSGDFYNLYDSNIAPQCSPIHLQAVSLVEC